MEREFDTIPIPKLVLRLGLPAMLAQFFNILYSVVDRIFVGHITPHGTLALAAVGLCAPALTAVTAFATLIGIGGASVLSISMGRRDRATAQHAINNSFCLLLGTSLALTVLLLAVQRPLLYLLGSSDAIYPYAAAYFQTYVLGTVAALTGVGMNQFLLAQGLARQGMLSVLLGAGVNTVLDPLFIFGLDMGVRGAALATVLAQVCVLAYVLSVLLRGKAPLSIRWERLHRKTVQTILSIGCLPFFIILLDNLLIMLLNSALRRYGGDLGDALLSCGAVVQSFMVLAYYPAQGITTGCGTLYGYHYGAGHYRKVMQVFRWVFCLCAVFLTLLCIASQTIPTTFAALFTQDDSLVPLAASCIRKYAAGLLGVAVQYAFVDGLTAMGQMRAALPISFFRKGLYVLCVLVLPHLRPIQDVFWSAAISDLVGACVTLLVFGLVIAPRLKREMTAEGACP